MSKKKTASASVTNLKVPPAANAAEVPSLYVNNVEVLSMSTIDVRLGFNEIALEGKNGTTKRKANIVMSVPHFIAMTNMFNASAASLTSVEHRGIGADGR